MEDIYIQADLTLAPDFSSADKAGEDGNFEIIQISKGLSLQDPDGYNVSTYLLWTEGGRNYSGWVDPEWRALMEQQFLISDQEERAVILRNMARIFHDDANMIGSVRPGVIGLYRKTIQGWTPPIIHTSNYSLEEVWVIGEAAPTPTPTPPLVPGLTQWGLGLLSGLFIIVFFWRLRHSPNGVRQR